MSDEQAMIAEYLSRGGRVTKCDPGPSENVVYRSGPRFRRQPKAAPAETPATEAPAPSEG